nr:hypothetical protein [Candidatus Coxiella mudrowiae]
MGRKVKIRLYKLREGQHQICGIIWMTKQGVTLETDDMIVKIGWDEIERANLMADF